MDTSNPTINPRPSSAQIIDDAMQQKLNIDKVQLRVENEHYLRAHPEIRHILDFFVNEVLVQQPGNVQEFAAGLFSDAKLQAKVEQHTVETRHLQEDMADMNDF
ncbi:RIIa domain-containing protein 1 [Geranomyces variabilis]|uniref:RIIa domain-containing protein 1 n=1 Tax=Geranomyces variabilis TaxID=109894 RepID=A0AAD5TEK7_9FUNG|nr:RIIa domain-containing protein 1 [Geranomyces variabilis]